MEYISIPWDNHRQGDVGSHDIWTVNLALWVVHILAGNNYKAGWRYDALENERVPIPAETRNDPALILAEEGTDEEREREDEGEEVESNHSDDSDRTAPFDIGYLTKRKRDSDTEDGYHLSFSKRQVLEV